MRYNMMPKRIRVMAESDTIASNRYDASRDRFLAGRITVTDLNIAHQYAIIRNLHAIDKNHPFVARF
jgi:hypothetical protein